MDNTQLFFLNVPLFKKEEHLMHSLNRYGIVTVLTYPLHREPEIIAKFKDGTLWLIRITDTPKNSPQLSVTKVLDSMNFYDKAKKINATAVVCRIQSEKMIAHFYHLSGRGPFEHLPLTWSLI